MNWVYSSATCCKSSEYPNVRFSCIAVWSNQTENWVAGVSSSVSCPSSDYFMTSCSSAYVQYLFYLYY